MHVKRVRRGAYDVSFPSHLREWLVRIMLTDAWLMLRTFVMNLPEPAPRRAALLEAAMQANGRLSLTKFSLADATSLCLELEYRAEHTDAAVLQNLIGLVVKVGDAEYPPLFRIASGDAALEALESAFNRPSAEG